MIKNIIFDFDGVIVDSEIIPAKAFAIYFKSLGHKTNEKDFYSYIGNTTYQTIDELTKKYNIIDKSKFTDEIYKQIWSLFYKELRLVKGADKYIKNSDKNLFIGSNSTLDRLIKGLEIVNLKKFFPSSKIYTYEMVNNPKPSPDIYKKIITDNKLINDETIIIEDSKIGIKAGVSANIKVIAITAASHWYSGRNKSQLKKSGASYVVNDYNNIKNLIKEM